MSHGLLGDYLIVKKLGSGSFAVVYQAEHRTTKQIVAIKTIPKSKLNKKLQENLEQEINILRRFKHDNIVRLYEILKTEKHIHLVFEYCGGGDLHKFVRSKGKLSESVVRRFMKQLANGLKFLWSHNLIHRDIKPQNLLLTEFSEDCTLKIADFGFARHLETASLAETLCGSPLYMAPEILRFHKYDAKADLWSVGTVLYEMLVGKPPFGGLNHMQLLANIERQELRVPPSIHLSAPCLQLMQRLLCRDPVMRISFEEFFNAPFLQLPDDVSVDLEEPSAVVDEDSSPHFGAVAREPHVSKLPTKRLVAMARERSVSLPLDLSLQESSIPAMPPSSLRNRTMALKESLGKTSLKTNPFKEDMPSSFSTRLPVSDGVLKEGDGSFVMVGSGKPVLETLGRQHRQEMVVVAEAAWQRSFKLKEQAQAVLELAEVFERVPSGSTRNMTDSIANQDRMWGWLIRELDSTSTPRSKVLSWVVSDGQHCQMASLSMYLIALRMLKKAVSGLAAVLSSYPDSAGLTESAVPVALSRLANLKGELQTTFSRTVEKAKAVCSDDTLCQVPYPSSSSGITLKSLDVAQGISVCVGCPQAQPMNRSCVQAVSLSGRALMQLLYEIAIRFGREGAIEELLERKHVAVQRYLKAIYYLEALHSDCVEADASWTDKDRKIVRAFHGSFLKRLSALRESQIEDVEKSVRMES